jgi:acyl-CoA thioester hydrolase
MSHATTIRVYYEDTDAGGVVYYANYLKYAERARTEWLRSRGINQHKLRDTQGIMFVVRHVEVDYHLPARLDDPLQVTTHAEAWRPASLQLIQKIWLGNSLLVSLAVKIACVNNSFKPTAIPEDVRQALSIN